MSDPYKHWFKSCAEMCIPQACDWHGVGGDVAEASRGLGRALGLTGLRLMVLLTFPVSVPLLARWCWKRAQFVEWLNKERDESVTEARNKLRQVVDKETA